jgi:hypothetical protein
VVTNGVGPPKKIVIDHGNWPVASPASTRVTSEKPSPLTSPAENGSSIVVMPGSGPTAVRPALPPRRYVLPASASAKPSPSASKRSPQLLVIGAERCPTQISQVALGALASWPARRLVTRQKAAPAGRVASGVAEVPATSIVSVTLPQARSPQIWTRVASLPAPAAQRNSGRCDVTTVAASGAIGRGACALPSPHVPALPLAMPPPAAPAVPPPVPVTTPPPSPPLPWPGFPCGTSSLS